MKPRHLIPALVSGGLLALASLMTGQAAASPPSNFVLFDGLSSHIDVPDNSDLSVATTGSMTVSAWMRPDTLSFPKTEGGGYVHWLGKGAGNQQEWTFRMYSQPNQNNRANRISFYVFNLSSPQPPNLGIGSYFQDPITAGQWIHLVGVADGHQTRIYENGVQRDCDQYNTSSGDHACQTYPSSEWITPQHGTAPMRMGTRDLISYFQGALAEVRVWNRALSAGEVSSLYGQDVAPRTGLVAEYLFGEGSGTIAHDTAGSHDATLVGATWSNTQPPPPPTTLMYPQGSAFPLGLYEIPTNANIGGLSGGWNIGQRYGWNQVNDPPAGEQSSNKFMQLLAQNQLDGLLHIPDYKDASGTQSEWEQAKVGSWIHALASNPNIAYWDLPEEPRYFNPTEFQIVKDYPGWTRTFDPQQRPNYMYLTSSYTRDKVQNYVPYLDVIPAAAYADDLGQPHAWIRWRMEETIAGIQDAGATIGPNYLGGQKTPVGIVGLFVGKNGIVPTPEQTYHDFWQLIASGAKGIFVYSYAHASDQNGALLPNLQSLGRAAAQLTAGDSSSSFAGAILNGQPVSGVSSSVSSGPAQTVSFTPTGTTTPVQYPAIHVWAQQFNNQIYLIAVNSTDQNVSAQIAGLPMASGTANLPAESRSLPIAGGAFADTFPAWGVHLYEAVSTSTTIETISSSAMPIAFTPGQPFSGPVATFTDSDSSVVASNLQAAIDWGDSGTSTGNVSGQNGSFQVTGTHTYMNPGTYTVQVTLLNANTQTQGGVQTTASVAGQFLITTFAGTGAGGYTGDGQPATSAQISGPSSVAADKSGNVYILDAANYRVRKVDASGMIHTFAGNGTNDNKCGGGPGVGVGFDLPLGVAVDGGGVVYMADYLCGMVFKIDPGTGNAVTTVAGSPCLGTPGQACLPGDGGPAIQTSLSGPSAVAVDKAGNLYISQADANLVRKVDTHGTISTFAGKVDTSSPSFAGVSGYTGDEGPAAQAELSGPVGLVVDDAGNVYIADSLNNAVRKVDTSGKIHTFAGGGSGSGAQGFAGDEGPAVAAQLSQPTGVAVDTTGGVYIADSANSVVRFVDQKGIIHTLAGNGTPGFSGDGGPATAAQMYGSGAVAVYDPGIQGTVHALQVYITDTNNNRVRVAYLTPPPQVH